MCKARLNKIWCTKRLNLLIVVVVVVVVVVIIIIIIMQRLTRHVSIIGMTNRRRNTRDWLGKTSPK